MLRAVLPDGAITGGASDTLEGILHQVQLLQLSDPEADITLYPPKPRLGPCI